MEHTQKQIISERIDTALLILWGITFLLFPLFFGTFTTDPIFLPKQILVGIVVILSLVGWGTQILLNGQVRFRRTPLDIPVLLFGLALFLSSIFSVNRANSFVVSVQVLFLIVAYFLLTNLFRTRKASLFLLSTLLTGGVLSSLLTVLASYKIYLLPFAIAKVTTFAPLGNYLIVIMYVISLLPLTFSFITPAFKKELSARVGIFSVAAIILTAVAAVLGTMLMNSQKVALLPFDTGLQTAFASLSQDSGRVLQSFLFGGGIGNFGSIFSRFHSAAFNANQQLWYLSFNQSSSYVLELLATTGLVGILAYVFLAIRVLTPLKKKRNNPFYLSLIVVFTLSLVLPFFYPQIALFFFLLAGYSVMQREITPHEYFDIELQFVALKKGVFSFTTLDDAVKVRRDSHPTPIVACIVLYAIALVLGYYATIYVVSDIIFQNSLVTASKNNGTATYKLQAQAISIYPYRSDFYRIFSQTNISLASSLLSLEAGKSSPSATTQQTALTLIQQAITTGRQATNLNPASAIEWQNLSSVYRTLIGVGQNAQDFAITTAQQATLLDSANPQEYLNLGGLYYQLGQYDNAIRMFQQAIALKSDYANAYYNLGHAYEQKGDLQNALAQYQVVQSLVANDKVNSDRIASEINSLQAKIGNAKPTQQTNTTQTPVNGQQQLTLPGQNQLPVSPTPTR